MTDWLIDNLPPEAGPLLLGIVGSYGTSRPLLILLFSSVLAFEIVLAHGIYRYVTRG